MYNSKLICTLMLFAWLRPLHAIIKRQIIYGSTVPAAGNPQLPTFSLSATQLADFAPISPDVYQDAFLPTPLLAYKRGYAAETHRVVTPDGYILEIHRIISSPLRPFSKYKKPVAFLLHGILDTSATWLMSGRDHGLGYALADAGYDVWMGNVRGNSYSRKHVLYDPDGSRSDREKFWKFSWHEIGVYDTPTMIDYILSVTGQKTLHYIGHSQGTTAFFVMCAEKPEYNAKIRLMHALAPVAYMDHAVSPVVKLTELFPSTFKSVTDALGAYEFLPTIDLFTSIGRQICRDTSPIISICESVLFSITGFNYENLNATLFPVFLSHLPAGAATYQLVHYVQEANSKRFCKFDMGSPLDNFEKYGSIIPPEYNLANVVAPVILHYSDNDWLASSIDVERLYRKLPNAKLQPVPDRTYEHMDFVWGIKARTHIYEPIIASMKLYDKLARFVG